MVMPRHLNITGRIASSYERQEGGDESGNDADISDVEHRPPPEVDEVDNGAAAQNVAQVSGGAAERGADTQHRKMTLEGGARGMEDRGARQREEPDQHETDA